MNFCIKCGLQIEEGLNFCTSCGEAIHATDETPEMPDSIPDTPDPALDDAHDSTSDDVPDPASDAHDPTSDALDPAPDAPCPIPDTPDSTSDDVPEPTSDIPPPTPTYTPQYQAHPQKNELVADSLSSIAKTFTANPEDGAEAVIRAKSPAWAAIGALYVLIFALATHVIHYVIMRDFGFGDIAGQRFLNGLFIGILHFVGLACCVKLLYSIFKKNVSFLKAITIVAGCSIIVSIIMIAVIVMSFISIWVAQLLMTLSAVAFHIMVYSFIKSTSEFKNSPLWAYLGLIAALNITAHYCQQCAGLAGF